MWVVCADPKRAPFPSSHIRTRSNRPPPPDQKQNKKHSWAQLLEGEGVISKFVPIDFSDADTVLDQCLAGIRGAVEKLGGALDGALFVVVVCVVCVVVLFCVVCVMGARLDLSTGDPKTDFCPGGRDGTWGV